MKKFIIKTLFYLIPFYCVYGAYKISSIYFSGDIGRLGKIPFGWEYVRYLRKDYLTDNLTIDTVIVSHEKLQIADASNVCAIGDSFSMQGIFGYQNYLAHLLGFKIININNYPENPLTTYAMLLNSGIIDGSNCRILILEFVSRDIIQKLNSVNLKKTYKLSKRNNKNTGKNSELHDLNSFIRLRIDYNNPVYKSNLKQECFTHDYFSKTLFYYKNDMKFLKISEANIEKAKENLVFLNSKILEKGIKPIFLIAADKYDVYRPFMTDTSLPVDTTTDGLSGISGVLVIDTKPLLQEMVQNGEKDVYMANDSHWSHKASKAVALKLAHAIDSLGIFYIP
jgi:hypothetical protein